MKILNPYRFCKGMGGGDSAPIPALVAPDTQSLLKSISISETVDLLCEGPIYGLVDQFGKKVYGLDMLKGIYLNKIPVMNYDGKYNFRNIVMEINLGTENQKPLQNFNNVYIYKQANFKLLGPITTDKDTRPDPNGGPLRDFTSWATGWPTTAQDPFVYTHHIKNKDVKKIRISLVVEALYDTVDQGPSSGKSGKMGMSKETSLTVLVTYGTEGTNKITSKEFTITGTATSPFVTMIGEPIGQAQTIPAAATASVGGAVAGGGGAVVNVNSVTPPLSDPRNNVGFTEDQLKAIQPKGEAE